MDMPVNFSEELYMLVLDRISKLKSEEVIVQAKAALQVVKEALSRLKQYHSVNPFSDAFAERKYQEIILPRFLALDFYYRELIWMEYNKPIGDDAELISYYKQEVSFIRHFFSRHAAQYHVYKVRSLELEAEYLPQDQLIPEIGYQEELPFSGEFYCMTAKFMGYEKLLRGTLCRLEAYEQVERVLMPGSGSRVPVKPLGNGLQWTGKFCNLVELVYGIYESKQINNGEVPIAVLIRWVEESLQVDMKSVYTVYDDIKSRKRINPVCFLESMRIGLMNRIASDLGCVPDSFKIGI